jgi:beta-1,3(4)-glucanase
MRYTPECVSVQNGVLSLTAKPVDPSTNKGQPFVSGSIETKTDKEVLFSLSGNFRVVASIKLPKGKSSWCSLWLTGTRKKVEGEEEIGWPWCGEIDVFESNGCPDFLQMNTHSPREGNPSKSQQQQRAYRAPFNTQDEFHLYKVEKFTDQIRFYVDDRLVHTVFYKDLYDPSPFTDPENEWVLRLSHMVGGKFLELPMGNKEFVDATKHIDSYPSSMEVDWIYTEQIREPLPPKRSFWEILEGFLWKILPKGIK